LSLPSVYLPCVLRGFEIVGSLYESGNHFYERSGEKYAKKSWRLIVIGLPQKGCIATTMSFRRSGLHLLHPERS